MYNLVDVVRLVRNFFSVYEHTWSVPKNFSVEICFQCPYPPRVPTWTEMYPSIILLKFYYSVTGGDVTVLFIFWLKL